jgi:DTW domain-containing protein YfiP
VNSEIRVRGDGREGLDLRDLVTPQYRSLLLYPSDDAVELSRMLLAEEQRPVQLIVPDGTWRQAGKIHYRHRELKDVQRVKISTPTPAKFHLRAQHRDEGMATLQAIAQSLGILEGDVVKSQLMKLYDLKLEQTLLARGQVNLARSLGFTAKRDWEI